MFTDLMPLQGVLTGEGLSTGLAEKRFVTSMGIPMTLQVVLTIKGQSTHIAGEWAWGGSRILHGTVDRGLWNILRRVRGVVLHLGRLRPVWFRGTVVIVVVQLSVGHDRRHRLSGSV